jgi:hypothetical protein
MKISIATYIRLIFVLTLLIVSVSAETPVIEVRTRHGTSPSNWRTGLASARTALSRGEKHVKEFFTQSREAAKCRGDSHYLTAVASLPEISDEGVTK